MDGRTFADDVTQQMVEKVRREHGESSAHFPLIGDTEALLKDAKEIMPDVKDLLERGDKMLARLENSWLLKLLRI